MSFRYFLDKPYKKCKRQSLCFDCPRTDCEFEYGTGKEYFEQELIDWDILVYEAQAEKACQKYDRVIAEIQKDYKHLLAVRKRIRNMNSRSRYASARRKAISVNIDTPAAYADRVFPNSITNGRSFFINTSNLPRRFSDNLDLMSLPHIRGHNVDELLDCIHLQRIALEY